MSLLYGDEVAKAIEILVAIAYMWRADGFREFWESNSGWNDIFDIFRTKIRKSMLMRMKLELRRYLKWKVDMCRHTKRIAYEHLQSKIKQITTRIQKEDVREMKEECDKQNNSFIPSLQSRITMCMEGLKDLDKIKNGSIERQAFDTDSFEIGIDNRTSYSMTGYIGDMVGPMTPTSNYYIKGISGKNVPVNGIGTVKWSIEDDDGMQHGLLIPNSLYVKEFKGRLLSPQHWSQSSNDNHPEKDGTICITGARSIILKWEQRRYTKTVPIDVRNNCFSMRSSSGVGKFSRFRRIFNKQHKPIAEVCLIGNETLHNNEKVEGQEDSYSNVEDFHLSSRARKIEEGEDMDVPATTVQAELLRWHYRLGHVSFKKLKIMALLGILPKKLANVKPPVCAGCIYGGMTRKAWRSKPHKDGPRKIFKASEAGECVSVDQMESTVPGLMAQLKGRITRQRYTCATIFVDHYSDLSYVHLQRSLSSNETVDAKRSFESYARKHHVRILHYHADNGRFADNLFKEAVKESGQTISYCGVGAHFQNGRAEKKIRDLREAARKMMIHAMARWPKAISVNLWPYAIRTASDQHNYVPSTINGRSKMELFTGVEVGARLKSFHTWGCPVYALVNRLQGSAGSIPKWSPRARLGINLGFSPRHARSVSLVLNPQNGLASPQYHVKHDDFFETVKTDDGGIMASNWQNLAGLRVEKSRRDEEQVNRQQPDGDRLAIIENIEVDRSETDTKEPEKSKQIDTTDKSKKGSIIDEESGTRRSARLLSAELNANEGMAVDKTEKYYLAYHEDDYRIQDAMKDPISFKATSDPDTMYWHQAMKQPDADKFLQAAAKEFNSHHENNHWTMIERDQVPKGCNVLPSVWAMKRKRDIATQAIKKYKARLNLHGGKQVFGEDFYETYAPVVGWMTVRLLLIIAAIMKWRTRQVDFVLAYPQADIEQPMYMELPSGVLPTDSSKDYVLKLNKNLYGQKQAGRIWAEHLQNGLEKIGFQRSQIDECLFYRGSTLFAVYVDDGIFIDKNEESIEKAIKDLRKEGYNVEDIGTLNDYLGVKFEYTEDKLHLKQPHLIDQIVNDVRVMKKKFKAPSIPAKSTCILQRFEKSEPFNKRWHYRSIIGKLNYLEKCTRPDIAYAVHQCARFCEDPKEEHAKAVEFLVRYLAGTKDKGIILHPKNVPVIDVYADADFAGNWNKTTAEWDPSTAKSRTGYLINFAGCPIHWASKLQTQIALSTTEAEYIALSQSLREAIPVMQLVREMREKHIINIDDKAKIYCRCFEDNVGALELANTPKMRPRTKHINLVYHHFRSFARQGLIKVYSIESKEQICDLLTKPLPQNQFQYLRRKFMFW